MKIKQLQNELNNHKCEEYDCDICISISREIGKLQGKAGTWLDEAILKQTIGMSTNSIF